MTMQFREIAAHAAADGQITAEEILALRRVGWADGSIGADEAEALFLANDAIAEASEEWTDFFVEAVCEYLVSTLKPEGYVSEEQAAWLIARIDRDGALESLTELELLIRVFERAIAVPATLREYALAQVERAVLTGEGPTRCGGALEAGNVTEAEAKLIRRIVFATASERPAAVSRAEADMLYRIKDAALDGRNAPEWKRLFVQGVGNYIAGFTQHTAISHERAAELDAFMSDHRSSLGSFAVRMTKSAVSDNFFKTVGEAFGRKDPGPDAFDKAEAERAVDSDEQVWLERRIDANCKVDSYDAALLAFLEEESGFVR